MKDVFSLQLCPPLDILVTSGTTLQGGWMVITIIIILLLLFLIIIIIITRKYYRLGQGNMCSTKAVLSFIEPVVFARCLFICIAEYHIGCIFRYI